ncbi:hypothetical protein LPY66_16405 [Dehalobacter sp. DCM]|uniref:hypothetical protein n=1 Tax=Dehalobacter sp. DCM TaxID=2907827 RepID=UPI0030815937|nr:hypothetical protein LPY66_16405 [Dehalobacter sp. DCM]
MSLPLQAPTDYYCESLAPIDQQLCAIIAERKGACRGNPGFPPEDSITAWCEQYGLNKNLLFGIFSSLYHEHYFEPMVEPAGFIKFLPVLKSVKVNRVMYTVTYLKQYSNASIVSLEIESLDETADSNSGIGHAVLELTISPEYTCRQDSGHSQGNVMQQSFVVTPPLPDDLSGVEFNITIKPFPEVPDFRRFFTEEIAVTIK